MASLSAEVHQALAAAAPAFATAAHARELAWLRNRLGELDDPIDVLVSMAGRQPLEGEAPVLRAVGAWLEARLEAQAALEAAALAMEAGWLRRLARTAAHLGEYAAPEGEPPTQFGVPADVQRLRAARVRLLSEASEAADRLEAQAQVAEVVASVQDATPVVEDPLMGLAGLAVGGVDLGVPADGDLRLPPGALTPPPAEVDTEELADLPLGLRLVDQPLLVTLDDADQPPLVDADEAGVDATRVGLAGMFGDLDDP